VNLRRATGAGVLVELQAHMREEELRKGGNVRSIPLALVRITFQQPVSGRRAIFSRYRGVERAE
jgi:hypothetical protein